MQDGSSGTKLRGRKQAGEKPVELLFCDVAHTKNGSSEEFGGGKAKGGFPK